MPDRIACVVGAGTTEWGNFPETDATGLGVTAFKAALADAGLETTDIDGLVTSRLPSYARFAELVGLSPGTTISLPAEGRQSGVALALANVLVQSGKCATVALVYGNNGRSQRVYYGGDPGPFTPWGFTSMGALHAMLFRRYMALFGATHDQLAEIPITFRSHAARNNQAVMRAPIDRNDYHSSRWVVEPLHLYDYCLVNDGGVCLLVTSEDRARDLRKPVVRIKAAAEAGSFQGAPFYPEDFFFDACRRCAGNVYEVSGLTRDDMDALMIYDNFSPTVLFTLEGFGFCGRGEAAQWVQDGRLGLTGEFPANTSGGHLSESYMQGWALNVEAVRQLRGEAGDRQVPGCRHVQFMAATPITSSVIYERA